jgi:branched-chain amino acid transport system permease protein
MPRPWLRPALAAGGALLLVVLPHLLSLYQRTLLTEILIWSLFAMSLDVMYGYAGLLSFGHSAFFGVGAYSVALTILHWQFTLWQALAAAALVSCLFAGAVAAFAVRVRAHYFVVITVVISLVLFFAAMGWREVTGGDDGLIFNRPPLVARLSLSHPLVNYYFVLGVVGGLYLITRRVIDSPLGMAFKAVRDNELRARLLGYRVAWLKFTAFVLSGTLAGLAGGLYSLTVSFASVDFLRWTYPGDPVVWTVVGGAGTLIGPMLGALVLTVLRDLLSSVFMTVYPILVGLILIVAIIFFPKGIMGFVQDRFPALSWQHPGFAQPGLMAAERPSGNGPLVPSPPGRGSG